MVFLVFGIVYFIYHLINIDNGISSYFMKQNTLDAKVQEVEKIKNTITNMKFKINLLTKDPVDKDMLDEKARRLLGFKRSGEIVIDLKN